MAGNSDKWCCFTPFFSSEFINFTLSGQFSIKSFTWMFRPFLFVSGPPPANSRRDPSECFGHFGVQTFPILNSPTFFGGWLLYSAGFWQQIQGAWFLPWTSCNRTNPAHQDGWCQWKWWWGFERAGDAALRFFQGSEKQIWKWKWLKFFQTKKCHERKELYIIEKKYHERNLFYTMNLFQLKRKKGAFLCKHTF